MSKKKTKPAVGLFILLIVLFVLGMAAEIVLKYAAVPPRVNMPEVPHEVYRNMVLSQFGAEAFPFYALPALVLSWMSIQPRELLIYALYWLPYAVLFLLPVFGALARGRGRGVPLILCALAALYEGLSLIIASTVSNYYGFSVYTAIPFLVEFFILIIGCVGVFGRNRSLAVTAGVVFLALVPVSVFITPVIAELSAFLSLPGYPLKTFVVNAIKFFPVTYAQSHWPIFKAFAFAMYGLLLVTAVKKSGKKA